MIALREKSGSLPLLHALGVNREKVVVTGDDALEMAYSMRSGSFASGLGVNIRCSTYSGVHAGMLLQARDILRTVSAELGAPLVAVPVSFVPGEEDLQSLRETVLGGEVMPQVDAGLFRPADLIALIQRCRVVVTGSYHAGVFALASGIPVVALVGSLYYGGKFRGLADMFGAGCEIVALDEDGYPDALRSAVGRLWKVAPDLRPALLNRTEAQIAAGRAAYGRLQKSYDGSIVIPE